MKTIAQLNKKPDSKYGRALRREIQQKKQARYSHYEKPKGMTREQFREAMINGLGERWFIVPKENKGTEA
jgi:hypothetical protein